MTPRDHASGAVRGTRTIDRRGFLALAGGAVGAGCGALPLLAGACAARARYVTPAILDDRLVIPATQLAAAGALLVEDPRSDLPIYLRRTADAAGTVWYSAVSTKCGHRGCQVEPAADKLVCPCHGSQYTFDGAILQGPTQRALTRFRVTADAESVYIHWSTPEAP